MGHRISVGLALSLTLAASPAALAPAWADDSAAELDMGQLRFVHAEGITMQREDLTLSPDKVQVRFEMRNDRGETAHVRIGFPLPDLGPDLSETPVSLPYPEQANFVGFTAAVNDKPVSVAPVVRAMLKGRDITAALLAAGIDVTKAPTPDSRDSRSLSQARRQQLVALGAYEYDPTTDAKDTPIGSAIDMHALWTTQVGFTWEQDFPPGVTVITHSYKPVLGSFFVQKTDLADASNGALKPYCIDPPTRAAIRHLLPQAEPSLLTANTLGYVLKTGGNWAGPIGTFHLTLESTENGVLSLCLPDMELKRSGKQRFEATAQDYHPTHDLALMYVRPNTDDQ